MIKWTTIKNLAELATGERFLMTDNLGNVLFAHYGQNHFGQGYADQLMSWRTDNNTVITSTLVAYSRVNKPSKAK